MIRNSLLKRTVLLGIYRTSVTISWPVKRGKDFFKWQGFMKTVLDQKRVTYEDFENGIQYKRGLQSKHDTTRRNLAQLMGFNPDNFSDDEFELSLMYLLPTDIYKPEYKPTLSHRPDIPTYLDIYRDMTLKGGKRPSSAGFYNADGDHQNSNIRNALGQINEVVADAEMSLNNPSKLDDFLGNETYLKALEETVDNTARLESSSETINEVHVALGNFPFRLNDDYNDESLQDLLTDLNSRIALRPDIIYSTYHRISKFLVESPLKLATSISEAALSREGEGGLPWVFQAKTMVSYYSYSATVTVLPGSGIITINGDSFFHYFPRMYDRMLALAPIRLTDMWGVVDVDVHVHDDGGERGISAAKCVASGIAECLTMYNPRLRWMLQRCIPIERAKEYKKAGKKNSRRRYRWRKR